MSELAMPVPTHPGVPVATGLTVEDVWAMPDVVGEHKQLIDGELFVNASPVPQHQLVVGEMAYLLRQALEGAGSTVLFAPLDVVMDPSTVVQPDVVVYDAEATSHIRAREVVPVEPTIVVEVSSPSTRRLDLVKKLDRYRRSSIAEYWFVDLEEWVVDVHRFADDAMETLGPGDELTTPRLPQVRIPIRVLFDAVPGWDPEG